MGVETKFLTKIPPTCPFYQEVKQAVNVLQSEVSGSTPIFQIVHGLVGGLEENGMLSPNEWVVRPLNSGKIIVHNDFLETQNLFSELETGEAHNLTWNADLTLQTFQDFMSITLDYRKRHKAIYDEALGLMSTQDRVTVRLFYQGNLANSHDEGLLLVAVPSPFDNPILWKNVFGFSEQQIEKLNTYSKIHECGVILSSKKYRDDKPRGHDYFSYAARAVIKHEVATIQDKFLLTAKHEGSHGIIDETVLSLISVSNSNPIDEGFVNAISGEVKADAYTYLSLQNLLENPKPSLTEMEPDKLADYKREANYIAGTKFFHSLFQLVKTKEGGADETIWSKITAKMFKLALQLKKDNLTGTENQKISIFMKRLIEELGIPFQELQSIYDSLNQK